MRYILLLVFLFFPLTLKAQDCVIKRTQDILNCALNRHPSIEEAQTVVKRDESLQKIAKTRVNPELSSKIVSGDIPGGDVLNTETTLFHTLDWARKRHSRIKQAKAITQQAEAAFLQTRDNVALDVVFASNRLRQIASEKRLLTENRETFQHILNSFQSRKLLSPEQQVSQHVFTAGGQQMSFKLASLLNEEASLKLNLEIATGTAYKTLAPLLPKPRSRWPKLTSANKSIASAQEKMAVADLALAKANVKAAQSEAFPNLRIGPTIETQKQAGNTEVLAGASVEFPLPLFNLNKGNRTYARLDEKRASLHYASLIKKTTGERENQILRYQTALKNLNSLRRLPQSTNLNHENMDKLFADGLVSSSLIIEAHRQGLELAEAQHAEELAALEALWKVLIIDGKTAEGTL